MSKYSNEHHVRAPQAGLLREAEAWLWGAPNVVSVEVRGVDRPVEPEDFDAAPEALVRRWVVWPEDETGWTVLNGDWGGDDEALVEHFARTFGADALYGHDNDQVDNWRWIRFAAGARRDEYWYTGQLRVRFPDRSPKEALDLWEAFESAGRIYGHRSFSQALAEARRASGVRKERTRVLGVTFGPR